jgi:transposase
VRRLLGKWRKLNASERDHAVRHTSQPSAKAIAWWLLKPLTGRTPEQQRLVELFRATCPAVERAAALSDEFTRLVRDRLAGDLEPWIEQALAPESPIDLRRFAKGLRNDLAAVTAALTMPWSNGQTEGQVNRLKLIKRQMFGGAKFDLLRRRVLNRQV